jgi:quercetin dioxygenase-like cupin family protein
MVRRELIKNDMVECCGGKGIAHAENWLGEGETSPNLNMVATITIAPGDSVGDHTHTGEAELYYIIQGEAEYHDNDESYPIKAGDVVICYSGDSHGIISTGKEDLVFHAVIVAG